MHIRNLISLAALTGGLVFSLALAWEFALHPGLAGGGGSGSEAHPWVFLLIATLAALFAWALSLPITLRVLQACGWSAADLVDAGPATERRAPVAAGSRASEPSAEPVGCRSNEPPGAGDGPASSVDRIFAQLVSSLDRAEADIRAKSTFLANMSHELRTPLNAIIGFSDLMQREYERTADAAIPAKHLEYVRDIHNAGQYLLHLVNDILDLSKIESGADGLRDDEVRIDETLEGAVALVRDRALNGGIEIRTDLPQAAPLLRADARRLKQIFVNLLTNAVKFTPPGGEVTVKAWCAPQNGYVFQVSDNGIGMRLSDIPKALTPFHQIDNALSRENDGAGIGLPLTKALVEAHGGSLDLQSRLGQGTTVTLRFPAERVVAAEAPGGRESAS